MDLMTCYQKLRLKKVELLLPTDKEMLFKIVVFIPKGLNIRLEAP